MIAKSKAGGLCATCVHDQDCTFPRSPASPVTHCEEFDAGPPTRGCSGAGEDRGRQMRPKGVPVLAEGLCCTCMHREGCGFPHAGKSVQRCEEYA